MQATSQTRAAILRFATAAQRLAAAMKAVAQAPGSRAAIEELLAAAVEYRDSYDGGGEFLCAEAAPRCGPRDPAD